MFSDLFKVIAKVALNCNAFNRNDNQNIHDYIFSIVPRENRKLNRKVANHYGYFWLPCPICGEEFAGFEWLYDHTLKTSDHSGTGVCYKKECKEKADALNIINSFTK